MDYLDCLVLRCNLRGYSLRNLSEARLTQRILVIQYGDLRHSLHSFDRNGVETFRDQRLTVECIRALSLKAEVLTVSVTEVYDEETYAPGLRLLGVGPRGLTEDALRDLFDRFQPSHVVLRAPVRQVLHEAGRRRVPVLPWFDLSFGGTGWRAFARRMAMRRALRRARVPCLANQSVAMARNTGLRLLWPRSRTVAWRHTPLPMQGSPREEVPDPTRPRVFYAGSLSEEKGVGDALVALRILRDRGIHAQLTLAGRGDATPMIDTATRLGVAEQVRFLGVIPHSEVLERMARADMVVVTAHHAFFDGLPHAMSEALSVRTPVILPDHKSILDCLDHGEECLIFEAANPLSLTDSVSMLCASPGLYGRLSRNSERALAKLNKGLPWQDMLVLFLDDPWNRSRWVQEHSLNARKQGG